MCGGGKKPPPDNSIQLQQMQEAERARNRQREEERAAAEAAARRSSFDNGLNNAISTARERAANRFTSLGLDPNQYSGLIEDAIKGTRSQIADLDPNPGQYFGDNFIDSAIARQTEADRARFGRQVDSFFTPGKESTIFTDNMDDPFIDAVLGRQRQEAVSALDSARRRGNLDTTGYTAAMRRLDEMGNAGRSTAQDLGKTVLDRYRSTIRGIGDEARSAIGSYDLGDSFDPSIYQNRFDTTVGDLTGRLEGDVSGALSGQNFFDIGDIISRGGAAQGAQNAPAMLDAIAERNRVRNADRGVGGTGSF